MGLTIAQRQAQLAANVASTTASDVGRVTAAADATRNVAAASVWKLRRKPQKTAGQSEVCMLANCSPSFARRAACAKFDEDRVTDETRRGQVETRLMALGSSIEGLQKRMNELNVPDVTVLANLEQNLQRKITESSVDANVGLDKLSKRLEEQVEIK